MSDERQYYNPYHLIEEVAVLLRERGLEPSLTEGHLGDAAAGAGQLLRALAVTPAMDVVETLDRTPKPYR
ncbi:hypothetical protein GCM10009555_007190 [Acrocarpospora macrocephala]|uniref:Uncharacterized protein n=1 Tax=Acrocarpospora macrocephala TaxID=150177 RepID=A0A5M3WXR1_9ACTN|nr:hypothetical protein Amac_067830 [Acrocarpospora macrocephala]